MWRTPFSTRLSDQAVEVVGVAVDRHRPVAASSSSRWPAATGRDLGDRRRRRSRARSQLAPRAGAPGVGAGEQQQVGDQAAHPPRRAERAGDDLLLVGVGARARRGWPRAARGWRGCWSAACAARARRRRRSRAGPGSSAGSPTRAASSSRSIWSSVRASSATSSSVSGIGSRRDGSRVVGDLARRGGQRRRSGASPGRRPPARRARRASCRRRRRTARNSQRRSIGRVERVAAARVLDVELGADRARRSSGWWRPRSRRRWRPRRVRARPRSGAPGVLDRLAVPIDDPDRGVAGHRERSSVAAGRAARARLSSCELDSGSWLAVAEQLVVEVVRDPVGRQPPDDQREARRRISSVSPAETPASRQRTGQRGREQ